MEEINIGSENDIIFYEDVGCLKYQRQFIS